MVKRYTLREIFTALNTGNDLNMPDCGVVPETDYDALAADKADDLRRMAHDANTIHALQSRVQALEAALRELLSLADITQPYPEHLPVGVVSRARAALNPTQSAPAQQPETTGEQP